MIKIVQFVGIAMIGEVGEDKDILIDPRAVFHRQNDSNTGMILTFESLIGYPKAIDLKAFQFSYEPNVEIQDIYLQARSGLTLVTTTSPASH